MVTPLSSKTMIIKSLIMIMIIKIHLGENLLAQAKAPAPRRATPPVATAAMLEKGRGVIFCDDYDSLFFFVHYHDHFNYRKRGTLPVVTTDESHHFILKLLTIRNLAQKGLIS